MNVGRIYGLLGIHELIIANLSRRRRRRRQRRPNTVCSRFRWRFVRRALVRRHRLRICENCLWIYVVLVVSVVVYVEHWTVQSTAYSVMWTYRSAILLLLLLLLFDRPCAINFLGAHKFIGFNRTRARTNTVLSSLKSEHRQRHMKAPFGAKLLCRNGQTQIS